MKNQSIVFGICLMLAVGTAMAQVASTLSGQLRDAANYFSDSQGHIPLPLDTGEVLYLATATAGAPYLFYTAGAPVADDASLAACSVGASGQPVRCPAGYGSIWLQELQKMQAAEADPTAITVGGVNINCQKLGPTSSICRVTWNDGSSSDYECYGGKCRPLP